ncbi:MAG: alkaline phosphatase family protein [Gemmatimonadales bacterium]
MSAEVLALGIDAASPALIDRWCATGDLPHLAALRARGMSGSVRGLEGFFVGSTWPSLYTATSPARHGIHYQVQIDPGSYRLHRPAEGAYVRTPPFWRALGAVGRRTAILDVPLARLDGSIAGVQTVEWGGHDSLFGFGAIPESLGREIVARFGHHPVGPVCDARRATHEEYRAFIDRAVAGAAAKAALTRWVVDRERWDLVFQVFTEAHCAGHQCWHLHDPTHPAHPTLPGPFTAGPSRSDPLRQVYQAIDRAIGSLIEASPDARVLVFSGHGMSHWYGAQFLLPAILERLGATIPLARGAPSPAPIRAALRTAWRALPELIRRPLEPLRRAVADRPAHPVPTLWGDPARSRCFPVGNGQAVGGIRLNLTGREPSGVLRPGAEADGFVAELTGQLLAIVDRRDGGPLVSRVVRTSDLFQGDALDHLPDLLVEWSDRLATGSSAVAGGVAATITVWSPATGEITGTNDYGRTGEHRRDGFVIGAGPGIPVGTLGQPASVMDLAPTLASWLGAELPGVDGRPIAELLPTGSKS